MLQLSQFVVKDLLDGFKTIYSLDWNVGGPKK